MDRVFMYDGDNEIDLFDWDGDLIQSFDLEDAERLLKSLTDAVASLRESRYYVQVRFDLARNSLAQTYTYNDPSGKLKVGDLVQAPVGYDANPTTAKVVALGRGAWDGPVKNIKAKLEATPL